MSEQSDGNGDMSENIVEVLNELHAINAKEQLRVIDCYALRMEDDPVEKEFWAKYEDAIEQVRRVWGEPAYEGRGPRWGYKGDSPASGLSDYGHAIRIGWWRTGEFITVVMATGHDADTMLCLILAALEIPDNA